eukprot:6654193-Alexandrium_andersonii.AAC.1
MAAVPAADDGAPDDPVAAIDGLLASIVDEVFDAGAMQEARAGLAAAEPAASEVPHRPMPPQRAPPAGWWQAPDGTRLA